MIENMCALQSTGTWDLLPFPPGKSTDGCHLLYTIKFAPMVPLINSSLFWYQMIYTSVQVRLYSHFLPRSQNRVCTTIHYDTRMFSCMVIWMKRCTWSNHKDLLLRGSPLLWFVNFSSPYMWT